MLHTKQRKDWTAFNNVAETYESGRPAYTSKIFQYLTKTKHLNGTPNCIVEVGAGTGIFSKQLIDFYSKKLNNTKSQLKIILIEPLPKMRNILTKKFDNYNYNDNSNITIEISDGYGESMPSIKSNSVDIIFCATSFHWFANNLT